MQQFKIVLVISLVTVESFLTIALPYQHVVTFDPNDESLATKELILAAGLQVSPRADGTVENAMKDVPLTLRKGSNQMILAKDEKVAENKSKLEIANGDEESDLVRQVEADKISDKAEIVEESSENTLGAVLNPLNVKRPSNSSGHIYITIPIYINSMPGLPLTLSIGSQEIPLKATEPSIAARRQALEEEESPTSLYNKLL